MPHDDAPTYSVALTQSEIILIRDVVRHARLIDNVHYVSEIFSVDRKMTENLAAIFDQLNRG